MVDPNNPSLDPHLVLLAQQRFVPALRNNVHIKTDGKKIVEIAVGQSVAKLEDRQQLETFGRLALKFGLRAQDNFKEWVVYRNNHERIRSSNRGVEHMIESLVQDEALWMASENTEPVRAALDGRLKVAGMSPGI